MQETLGPEASSSGGCPVVVGKTRDPRSKPHVLVWIFVSVKTAEDGRDEIRSLGIAYLGFEKAPEKDRKRR